MRFRPTIDLRFFSVLLATASMLLSCERLEAAGTVVTPDDASVRAAMVGGGTVIFACDGTIYLTNTLTVVSSTVFDATGHSIVLSGSNAVRVLYVNSGVNLTMSNLVVRDGWSDLGAGLFNEGAVGLYSCVFTNNTVRGANGGTNQFGIGTPGVSGQGGAIYSKGTLWMQNVVFTTNRAIGGDGGYGNTDIGGSGTFGGDGGIGQGGAIYTTGQLAAVDCVFQSNQAIGGIGGDARIVFNSGFAGRGGEGHGGAIFSAGPGPAGLTNIIFQGNGAYGGNGGSSYLGGSGGGARGGGLLNARGSSSLSNCVFIGNQANRGNREQYDRVVPNTVAMGGGIGNTGSLVVVSCIFNANSAYGNIGCGGAVYHATGTLAVTSSMFNGNAANSSWGSTYYGGPGFPAFGGALFNSGVTTMTDTTFASNSANAGWAVPGSSGLGVYPGGGAFGGGVCSQGTTDVARCTFAFNASQGGNGTFRGGFPGTTSAGGDSFGGGVSALSGTTRAINSTFTGNRSKGGPGGSAPSNGYEWPAAGGSGGRAFGGGIYSISSTVAVTNCTIVTNQAVGGSGGIGNTYNQTHAPDGPIGATAGGGILWTNGALSIQNTIVNANTPNNVVGAFTGNHNLIGVDAFLGPLAANGGPTLTLALMPDSPAIDAATSVPDVSTDQRGVSRPYGAAPDIGAYEWDGAIFYSVFILRSVVASNGNWCVYGAGPTNQSFRLLVSSDLSSWTPTSTNLTGPLGVFRVVDSSEPPAARFYRTISP